MTLPAHRHCGDGDEDGDGDEVCVCVSFNISFFFFCETAFKWILHIQSVDDNPLYLSCIVCNYEHFSKKKYFLFKSFVKVELSYVVTINLISTAENCMEK